ncbi:MAG: beta-lactamase family protein, partial [Anaerolineae bacterium]|nr:beta-lactamase family protein [Anaerolineae bacterium]
MFPAKLKNLYRLVPGLLLLALMVMPGLAQDETDTVYTAPDESFTVTIPARWTDESTDEYGKFTLKDGNVLYLLRVDANEVQAGITAALAIVDPELDIAPVQTVDLPTPDHIWTQNVYALAEGVITAALGTVEGETTYVVYLVSPGMAEITEASPDLNTVLLSFKSSGGVDLAEVTPAVFDATLSADLEAYVTEALVDFNVPGAAVAIVQNGEVVYTNGFGMRELEGEPVDADTLFMIGSQTKSMTTLVLASLVDDEVFAWDTPVIEVLPSFALADPAITPQIRIRDLVNNSSGVARYDLPLALKNQTAQELIESLSTIPLVSPYGEKFNYSNQMFAAAGYIAALANGADYDSASLYDGYVQLMQERIFDPLGMTRSTLDFEAALADEN